MSSVLLFALLSLTLASRAGNQAVEGDNGSELRPILERFQADEADLNRIYALRLSANRKKRLAELYSVSMKSLASLNFDKLSFDGQIDYVLYRNYLERHARQLEIEAKDQSKYAKLIPFAATITDSEEARRRMEPVDQERSASALNALAKQVKEMKPFLGDKLKASKFEANQAVFAVKSLRETLRHWFEFYNGYDPIFTWWVAEPFKSADQELDGYVGALREKLLGVKPDDENAIVGNPIGREALIAELGFAMIPYTPEELIAIAEKEYAWCLAEMKKASRELGFKDDWKKALEHVKNIHVEPGKQPALIRELALEAIQFVEQHDLATVPPLAKETWKMEMMTPDRQLVNPFFLGGEDIIVSYPTNSMTHDQKLMSMRGNNRFFARATVHHELIPGHHLQGFMQDRYMTYRSMFNTPFWTEGWALYWEMLLWNKGFSKSPEERVGVLFWRMHRCVRIMFSLKFHLGQLTPEQCIDLLVEKVGHERANAEGEVRRSFNGSYEPLYQAAYMLGGLQLMALHRELVDSGKMSDRQFHDAILHENNMPIEMVRAILIKQRLTRDFKSLCRFAE